VVSNAQHTLRARLVAAAWLAEEVLTWSCVDDAWSVAGAAVVVGTVVAAPGHGDVQFVQ
jgi:hypothetical protein